MRPTRNVKQGRSVCGLFGWAFSGGKRKDREVLARLTDLMSHRGPDGSGYWLFEPTAGNYQIGLGHRRLSIIDLNGGAQPMWSADGTIALAFNGEIYNYLELRQELELLGHRFRSQSDTEVLIEAYRRWGLDAVCRFRGMFAFALWDSRSQRTVLARDPFGKKPLFIAEQPGSLLFSSEIEPIIQFPGFDRSLDLSAFGHYLLNRYVPGPLTFFRNIKKLQPGHYGVWHDGRLTMGRYFIAPFGTTNPDIVRFEEAVDTFTKTLDEAVRLRMRSDAPFGVYLSGGINSSAVVATMAQHSVRAVRTFSVGFREKAYCELDHARTMARRFGADHEELVIEPDDFLSHWPNAIRRRGAPVSEASDIPILLLSRAASRTVKMVLTGEGSDELLGGYPKHRAEQWIGLYQQLIPQFLHRRLIAPMIHRLPYSMRRVKIAASAAGERDETNRMRIWFGGISPADRDAILGTISPTAPPDPYPFSARTSSQLRRTLFFDQTSWLPDNILERADRMMMAGSIEGRMPFMDTALASVVARFPDEFLIGCKGGKAVLRAAMKSVLPPDILDRRKVGFRVPFNEWFRGPFRDLLTSNELEIARICQPTVLQRLLGEHVAGRQNHERILWSLATLEMFLRTFKTPGLEAICATAA